MKKIILLFALVIGMTVNAQESEDAKSKVSYYASVGLSMTNTEDADAGDSGATPFELGSYPSVEFGMNKGNMSYGLAVGRRNLASYHADVNKDFSEIQNYWYEGKIYVNRPLGNSTIFMVLGVGNYIHTSDLFIEYGAGLSTPLSKSLSLTAQGTNWDGSWYVTPGLQIAF